MFSLFIATRWHCRLKGKHLLLISEVWGRWETWKKTVQPPWNSLSWRCKEDFFFPLTVLQVDRREHDVCYVMITKSFDWFSIRKYIWAVWSCYFALLLPLACGAVFRAERKVMALPDRLFYFSLCVQTLKKTHFFLLLSTPAPPVTFPLLSVQTQIWLKFVPLKGWQL